MEVNWDAREVVMSVRELAEFGPGRVGFTGNRFRGRWRTEAGQMWHRELRTLAADETSNIAFEHPIRGVLRAAGWSFHLQGRIDQLLHSEDGMLVREIKSTTEPLPMSLETLQSRFQAHVSQLAIYVELLLLEGSANASPPVKGELLFVEVETGITQRVPVSEPHRYASESCARVATFLEIRRHQRIVIQSTPIRAAFPVLREGQEPVLTALRQALLSCGARTVNAVHFFQAPTGFGKTGLVLQVALEALQESAIERIVYISGKATGQIGVQEHLEGILLEAAAPRFFRMRSRREHQYRCPLAACGARGNCLEGLQNAWDRETMAHWKWADAPNLTLDHVFSASEESGICPYSISRSLLSQADIWIGDYNYVFAPTSRHVFSDTPAFAAERSLLIIDEAHNLAERVAASWSFSCRSEAWLTLAGSARLAGLPTQLVQAIDAFSRFLSEMAPCDALELHAEYLLIDHLELLGRTLQGSWIPNDTLPDETWDLVWEVFPMLDFLKSDDLERLLWSPEPGILNLTCLDASSAIAAALRQYRVVVAMSATLPPQSTLLRQWGIGDQGSNFIIGESPWRENAYCVAIDVRVDTRLKARENYYATTARTALMMCQRSTLPLIVFLSSYRYAEAIAAYIEAMDPAFPYAIQSRAIHENDRREFLESSLLTARAILLVMGGAFAEGIDMLGGRVDSVLIVGPALPEVNAPREATLDRHPSKTREIAFHDTYVVPGITKINQALGRLVRSPEHHARVLLQDRRFADARYRSLLDPDLRDPTIIRSEPELHAWLAEDFPAKR